MCAEAGALEANSLFSVPAASHSSPTRSPPGLAFKGAVPVPIGQSLRAYLTSKYEAGEVDKQADSIAALQACRDKVVGVRIANEGARAALVEYLAQLSSLEAKVPVDALHLSLSWNDSLRPSVTIAHSSALYERCCVVFNVAALESQMGSAIDRSSEDGKRRAREHFCAGEGRGGVEKGVGGCVSGGR